MFLSGEGAFSWGRSVFCTLLLMLGLSSHQVLAKDVSMAFSMDIPPYIFQEKDIGIEIDIIEAALAYKGHTLKPHYFPLEEFQLLFRKSQ